MLAMQNRVIVQVATVLQLLVQVWQLHKAWISGCLTLRAASMVIFEL
jgi:hypothetical protein